MASWRKYFSKVALDSGKKLFRSKKVKNFEEYGAYIEADVRDGSKNYSVSVTDQDSLQPLFDCECQLAKDGGFCRHMAAVMLYYDDMYGFSDYYDEPEKQSYDNKNSGTLHEKPVFIKETLVSVFEAPKEYSYFDMDYMTRNIAITEELVETLNNDKNKSRYFKDVKVRTGFENTVGHAERIAIVTGTSESGFTTEATLYRDYVKSVVCRMPGCNHKYSSEGTKDYGWPPSDTKYICKHGLALLISADKFFRENNMDLDDTDRQGDYVLRGFRRKSVSEKREGITEREENISLEPRLIYRNGGFYSSFRMGTGKMLMVKSLKELVSTVEEFGNYTLGKNTLIDFSQNTFNERSKAFYEIIRSAVEDEKSRNYHFNSGYRSLYYGEEIKGDIALYGKRLDKFFDIMKGHGAEIVKESGYKGKNKGYIIFSETNPEVNLNIYPDVDERNVFHGIKVNGMIPRIYEGDDHSYFYDNGDLSRIPDDLISAIRPLMPPVDFYRDDEKRIEFYIGRRRLSEFYYRVLPELSEHVNIKEYEPDIIKEHLPPEVYFIFYLDADDERLSCRADALYGNEKVSVMELRKGDVKKADFRDIEAEQEALDTVLYYFPEISWDEDLFCTGREADEMYKILDTGISELLALGEVQYSEDFRRIRLRKHFTLSFGVRIESGLMDLSINSDDVTREELLEILSQYKKKKKYYRLKNGDFLRLSGEELPALLNMMNTLSLTPKQIVEGKMHLPLYRSFYIDRMLEENSHLVSSRDSAFKELIKNSKTVSESDFDLSPNLKSIMRKYQLYGYRWMRMLSAYGFGGILADDMGLGKTIQVLSVLNQEKEEKKGGTSIVVCPASLVFNWAEESEKFTPDLHFITVAGSASERKKAIASAEKYDLLITSYDLLKRDIAEYEGKHFRYAVCDEAQYIKNHQTGAAKSVKLLESEVRLALTGTPIENRLSELHSIFEFLMPGFLYEYSEFKDRFEKPIVKYKDDDAIKELKRLVSPFILRRLKGDVLKDLPEKLEEIRIAGMEKEQQHLYDAQVVHMKNMISSMDEEDVKKNQIKILAEITKARRLCCDPALVVEDYKGGSAKRESCLEMIESAIEGEHKMLIFSQFTSMLELLEKDLSERGIPYYKLTGQTPKQERVRLSRNFNRDDTPVFLISLRAGGTGLNLTGADIVIHYDPWWNLAVENQATDRAHRIGQEKVVTVYKIIAKGTIEEKIVKLQETKQDLADEILSGEMGSLKKLTKDELMKLF